MDVTVCDAAGREVDPVAADDPADRGVELHFRSERRARSVTAELPDEGVAADASRSDRCLVSLEVVDDARPSLGFDSGRMLVEREPQWKYCPPSITIVCPVMKPAAGVQRKTTAPTTSSGS